MAGLYPTTCFFKKGQTGDKKGLCLREVVSAPLCALLLWAVISDSRREEKPCPNVLRWDGCGYPGPPTPPHAPSQLAVVWFQSVAVPCTCPAINLPPPLDECGTIRGRVPVKKVACAAALRLQPLISMPLILLLKKKENTLGNMFHSLWRRTKPLGPKGIEVGWVGKQTRQCWTLYLGSLAS